MTKRDKAMNIHRSKRRDIKGISWSALVVAVVVIATVGLFTVNLSPFRAFGGAVWLKDGFHYVSDVDISNRIEQLSAPKEELIADKISTLTPSCDSLAEGYCQRNPKEYTYKTLKTPAVEYVPGTPDRLEVVSYCTLCNDGTFSPSCAVGRGACSWHDGVDAYNVPKYRTIRGTPAVQAKPAVYSYPFKSYKDSPLYASPETPSLTTVVGF